MSLVLSLFEHGLLQFGMFQTSAEDVPFQLQLGFLPSYPHLLSQVARSIHQMLIPNHQRLLCDLEALPLGVSVSLMSETPLVYSRVALGFGGNDLVGAYDIGHPTCLLVNQLGEQSQRLIDVASSVGLEVSQIIALTDSVFNLDRAQILLPMDEAIEELHQAELITPGQAQTALEWLSKRGLLH